MIKEQKIWGLNYLLSDPINGLEKQSEKMEGKHVKMHRKASHWMD